MDETNSDGQPNKRHRANTPTASQSSHKQSFQSLATHALQIVQNHLMLPTAFRYVQVLAEKLSSLQEEIVESHVKYLQQSSSQGQQQETAEQLRVRLTASLTQELHCTATYNEMRSNVMRALDDALENRDYITIFTQYLPQTFLTVRMAYIFNTF
jgi:uncharacterized membrane protein YgaE (UPF0421/DUF939 family)